MKKHFYNTFLTIRSHFPLFVFLVLVIATFIVYSRFLYAEYTTGTNVTTGTTTSTAPTSTTTGTIPNVPENSNTTQDQEIISAPMGNTINTGSNPILLNNSIKTTVGQSISTGSVTPAKAATQIKNVGNIIEEINSETADTKGKLVEMVDKNVSAIATEARSTNKAIDTIQLYSLQNKIIDKINFRLGQSTTTSSDDIESLKKEINLGAKNIKSSFGQEGTAAANIDTVMSGETEQTLNALVANIERQVAPFGAQMGDLLFKDSNKDGVYDYDSIFVFNLDPVKPSPVSVSEGKEISAGEKILLGFDPTKSELVKVYKEEPVSGAVPVFSLYRVASIQFTENKQIVFKGRALPNSFVTLYVYSTPIIVTVKTDNNGEWQYFMKEELENGEHTIYLATVNNSGKIIARSAGFLFTKTAEAVTLDSLSPVNDSANIVRPGLFSGSNIYFLIIFIAVMLALFFVLIGVISKKTPQ